MAATGEKHQRWPWEVNTKKEKKAEERADTDGPGEALVLAHVGDVERLHGVLHILSIHVVHLADVSVPAETHQSRLEPTRAGGTRPAPPSLGRKQAVTRQPGEASQTPTTE